MSNPAMGPELVRFTLTWNRLPTGNRVVLVMLELRRSGFQISSLAVGVLDEPGENVLFVLGETCPYVKLGVVLISNMTDRMIVATANSFKQ